MNLPPLQPVSNSHFYVSGDVAIDPNAAIAPGVILQADPNSQIIIAAGTCIGMGAILHAYEGKIEVETGANLGAGVLVIGKGKIGANACIGSAATIFNCSIELGQVVPPASLLGDASRRVIEAPEVAGVIPLGASPPPRPGQITTTEATQMATPATSQSSPGHRAPDPSKNSSTQVYGQEQLNQLLGKLLPHRPSSS